MDAITPTMSLEQAQETVATKTAPRVTKETIEAKIGSVDYVVLGTLTICIITMQNGWRQIGHAAPASPENFDADVGRRYAYERAFQELWHLEGYALLNELQPGKASRARR